MTLRLPFVARRGNCGLEEFEVARVPIHAVWLPTRVLLAKAQLFAEALSARLKRERL